MGRSPYSLGRREGYRRVERRLRRRRRRDGGGEALRGVGSPSAEARLNQQRLQHTAAASACHAEASCPTPITSHSFFFLLSESLPSRVITSICLAMSKQGPLAKHAVLPAHKTKHIAELDYTFLQSTFRLSQLDNGHSNGTALWLGAQCLSAFLAHVYGNKHRAKQADAAKRPRVIELGSGIGLSAYVIVSTPIAHRTSHPDCSTGLYRCSCNFSVWS